MRGIACAAAIFFVLTSAAASDSGGGIVYGGDPKDGWAVSFSTPDGWQFNCCDGAAKYQLNLIVFPDSWSGNNRDGVIGLDVWKKDDATLDQDWESDAASYKKDFPDIVASSFNVHMKGATCRSAVYTGSDKLRDYVVFCDPGDNWKYRFSWSMLISPDRDAAQFESAFRHVVGDANVMHMTKDK